MSRLRPEFPLTTLLHDLGDDADLLTRSDQWLEVERRVTATKMNELAVALRAILLAQRVKRLLQQKNMVAVQHLLRDQTGEVRDIIVRIMNLPDAMQSITDHHDTLDSVNAAAQTHGWRADGYDLDTAESLRSVS